MEKSTKSARDLSKIICFDVETTGVDCNQDEILQISIIDGNRNVLFNELVKPTKIEEWTRAQEIHGISPEMVADRATVDEHLPCLNEIFASAKVLVGYNIGFDMSFIKAAGVKFPENALICDVMKEFAKVCQKAGYKKRTLEACATFYGYEAEGDFHDSLEDVKATLHCYLKMDQEGKWDAIEERQRHKELGLPIPESLQRRGDKSQRYHIWVKHQRFRQL